MDLFVKIDMDKYTLFFYTKQIIPEFMFQVPVWSVLRVLIP